MKKFSELEPGDKIYCVDTMYITNEETRTFTVNGQIEKFEQFNLYEISLDGYGHLAIDEKYYNEPSFEKNNFIYFADKNEFCRKMIEIYDNRIHKADEEIERYKNLIEDQERYKNNCRDKIKMYSKEIEFLQT